MIGIVVPSTRGWSFSDFLCVGTIVYRAPGVTVVPPGSLRKSRVIRDSFHTQSPGRFDTECGAADEPVNCGALVGLYHGVENDCLFNEARDWRVNLKWLRDKGKYQTNGRRLPVRETW